VRENSHAKDLYKSEQQEILSDLRWTQTERFFFQSVENDALGMNGALARLQRRDRM